MTTSQPERENRWAERREDYALRFVPLAHRRWSWLSRAHTEVLTASTEAPTQTCVKCAKHFELAEFVRCPFLEGPTCSVCCAAEPGCGELCKEQAEGPTPVAIEKKGR